MNFYYPGVDFLNMTLSLFEAHVEMMPEVRAERILDMAQAAAYPAMLQNSPEHAQSWWDALVERANGVVASTIATASRARGFFFNGVAVSFDQLHQKVSDALGGGVSQ